MHFTNRHEAGKKLAERLKKYKGKRDAIVLGIPRGGMEVAFEVAKELKAPLSVLVTKKIGDVDLSYYSIYSILILSTAYHFLYHNF